MRPKRLRTIGEEWADVESPRTSSVSYVTGRLSTIVKITANEFNEFTL